MTPTSDYLSFSLNVHSPKRLAEFYVNVLGFTAQRYGESIRLRFPHQKAYLELHQGQGDEAYEVGRYKRYWKFGLTLPDVDFAFEQLRERGVQVISEPSQRADVAYLGHILDPEGFQIELLQHTFEGQPLTAKANPSLPLGGGATLGYVTFRTSDIHSDLAYLQDTHGMVLLSKQEIPSFGFDLYFLGYTDECPPNPDISAVENRPWLWQRPYATFELQHWLSPDIKVSPLSETLIGFRGVHAHRSEPKRKTLILLP